MKDFAGELRASINSDRSLSCSVKMVVMFANMILMSPAGTILVAVSDAAFVNGFKYAYFEKKSKHIKNEQRI